MRPFRRRLAFVSALVVAAGSACGGGTDSDSGQDGDGGSGTAGSSTTAGTGGSSDAGDDGVDGETGEPTAAPSGELVFSPPGGIYTDTVAVEISADMPGAIHFSVDGSLPTDASPVYDAAIPLSETTQIRALFVADTGETDAASAPYIFASDALTASTNLPIVVVETWGSLDEINDPERPRDRHLVHSVLIEPNGGTAGFDTPPSFAGRGGMHIRGNSTTDYPKKQWSLELWKEDDSGKNVALLGLPKESDWVLHAPYSDKSLMRNYLMYTWSNRIGRYAAKTEFVEVWVDDDGLLEPDDYVGVYEFMEKVKVDEGRVSIDKLGPKDNALPQLSGGYLLQRDWLGEPGEQWLTTDTYGDEILFKSPKPDALTDAQRGYITDYMNAFEAALADPGFADTVTGYAAFIDVDSFIDHHLLVEMGRNVDGYVLSTYMHKGREGLLNMGPIWDYNGALGNASYFDCELPEGWHFDNDAFPADNPNGYHWYARLFEDPAFVERYQARWRELRRGPLSTANMLSDIDAAAARLNGAGAVERNFERWPVLGEDVWPNDPGAVDRVSYAEEIDYLQTWLTARVTWMDSQL